MEGLRWLKFAGPCAAMIEAVRPLETPCVAELSPLAEPLEEPLEEEDLAWLWRALCSAGAAELNTGFHMNISGQRIRG